MSVYSKYKMKLSIITPCYNEEDGISYLCHKLEEAEAKLKDYILELIFIDDGSTDRTFELLNKAYKNKENVKIIKHEKNMNVGAALRTGFKAASGDIIITIDSDCTYDPIEIPNLLKLLDKDTDIVTASPYHPDGKVENAPAYRVFLSKAASKIYALITRSKIYTFTSIFRAYRKDVVKNINFKSNDFLAPAEILILAIFKKYRVKEYPTTLHVRKFGVSKIKVLKAIKSHLKFIFYILKLKISRK